ncbi:sensor histidine kinase [Luteibacter sp. UNCMF366Tsu5.1]|uniref:sensor histidine kinase n=1 Tax=Luteibacter sp. UNCMF366Tsu5.1 TaxID=1502758 RepID=UPI000908A074|nr:sensor histidine kinase [Luteibacter sp. UNCMF366Tsu5.1]SFW70536.1 Two-component sensor histidine kinase, contains HisKA and HATPase domains [Luteibacter sp. UNCMF366Tsu5.1]
MIDELTSRQEDVTVLRDTARSQRVVIDDLNHRLKNVLMVVQAMARQSFRGDRPLDCSMTAFECRLRALAAAHDLLLKRTTQAVPLRDVVAATLAPHDPGNGRVCFSGPRLTLERETALAVAMALHELLTNAAKYGALSTPSGRIAITWQVPSEATDKVWIEWKERGGPPVTVPVHRGFGTRFIERTLACQAAGEAAIRFEPDGVRAVFEAPTQPD